MKLKHKTLIFLAGLVWIGIGAMLLSLGIRFILEALRHPVLLEGKFSILSFVGQFVADRSHAVILVVTLALLLGHFKGKMALGKSVDRQIKRIESFPNPAPLKHLYSKGYYLLIASMILLGILIRFLPITLDTRGAIDITIGSALINGAMLYFRHLSKRAYQEKQRDSTI